MPIQNAFWSALSVTGLEEFKNQAKFEIKIQEDAFDHLFVSSAEILGTNVWN